MKKVAYSILTLMLIAASTLVTSAQSQENRQVSGFNAIASSGPFNVHVKINGTESLKISASSKIINEIETIVEGGKLEIKFKHHNNWDEDNNEGRIDVYVTAKSLSGLANAGSGSIKVEGALSGENVSISVSGSGDITSSVKAGSLHASISGSGSVSLNGGVNDLKLSVSGSGEMNGKQLRSRTANIQLAGSGSAYIDVENRISASIVGSGNVIYTGNATVESTTIGSGRVSKAG